MTTRLSPIARVILYLSPKGRSKERIQGRQKYATEEEEELVEVSNVMALWAWGGE